MLSRTSGCGVAGWDVLREIVRRWGGRNATGIDQLRSRANVVGTEKQGNQYRDYHRAAEKIPALHGQQHEAAPRQGWRDMCNLKPGSAGRRGRICSAAAIGRSVPMRPAGGNSGSRVWVKSSSGWDRITLG